MECLAKYLEQAAQIHCHLCPRQVLGARMGLLAGKVLGLDLPQTDKRLMAFVETDGCFADGVSAATGCWLGRRTMRLMDFGKVAVTCVDTKTSNAIRVHPHPAIRQRAYEYVPDARSRWHAQLEAYQVMPDDALLVVKPVVLSLSLDDLISRPGVRVNCEACGEEIINEREVVHEGTLLCRACAGDAYCTLFEENVLEIRHATRYSLVRDTA